MFFPGSRRRPIEHGTIGGYRTHFRHGVPMCELCRHAHRVSKGFKAPQRTAVCGTEGGYNRHLNRKEIPCQPCCDARARGADERARRRRGDRWPYELLIPAVADLTAQGVPVADIADQLGVSRLRVGRARARAERSAA
jgi:hypothetical protein